MQILPMRIDKQRIIRAPTGTRITARSWLTEAPLRMLMNNLDPAVAERPEELVVYGGIGRAARNWECYDAIVAALKRLEAHQTLLIQSGKPVGVFETHADAPRVLLANSNLVPRWSTWEHFNELDRKGLMMFGQMTAGSWIYIGSQGIVQGTYETFVEMGRQHYGGNLAGRWLLTAGLGGMGGAQPLAAVMAGAACLAVECQRSRIDMRLKSGYLDHGTDKLDEALEIVQRACREKKPVSVGLLGNAAEVLPEMLERGVKPDLLTDQTSAHDPVNGYLPIGWSVEQWIEKRASDPAAVARAAKASMAVHVRAMLDFQKSGVHTVDYGNNIRQVALEEGVKNAFDFPGFVPAYIRPLFCRGVGPFRWVGLVGRSRGHRQNRRQGQRTAARRQAPASLAGHGAPTHPVPGIAGAHLLGGTRRPPPARPGVQRHGGERRAQGAHRHRARPPGFRLGRLAQPRNRRHAGWVGCRLRLAAAQCAAQHGLRRDLGFAAPRRRASAWASHNMPAWLSCATEPKRPRSVSDACCGTIRRPASCATPTRVTTSPSTRRANIGWICPASCVTPDLGGS
jgi:hypothetical protein